MNPSASLADRLAEQKAAAQARLPADRMATLTAATAELKASGIEQRALQVGAAAPALTLPDALGKPVELASLWQRGPLVLVFYRGGWCPYCNLGLRAWQQHLPALAERGARLVAVSPQPPDASLTTTEKNELAFPVLSDSSLALAEAFGVAFELPPALVETYKAFGNDLAKVNGNGRWVLPVPATYLIDTGGRIVWAHVDADYTTRAEPAEVIAALG